MTHTATDSLISASSIITPTVTIAQSGADQSQPPTDYDDINYNNSRLAFFRKRIKAARETGEPRDEATWTAARNKELKELKDDKDDEDEEFTARYGPFPDEPRQSEQKSGLASLHISYSSSS